MRACLYIRRSLSFQSIASPSEQEKLCYIVLIGRIQRNSFQSIASPSEQEINTEIRKAESKFVVSNQSRPLASRRTGAYGWSMFDQNPVSNQSRPLASRRPSVNQSIKSNADSFQSIASPSEQENYEIDNCYEDEEFPINRVPQRVGEKRFLLIQTNELEEFPINRVPQRVGEPQY